jgi:hypothetical protein
MPLRVPGLLPLASNVHDPAAIKPNEMDCVSYNVVSWVRGTGTRERTMRLVTTFLAVLAVVGVSSAYSPAQANLDAYLTRQDGRQVLKEPLSLREEQGGIAGITGTIWTVETSGHWRVEQFSDRGGTEHRTTLRTGILTPARLEELAKTMDAHNLAGLPEKTGPQPRVNPHNIIIKFGTKAAMLTGVPPRRNPSLAENIRQGATAKPEVETGVWQRFAHLAEAVETCCKAASPP